MRRTVRWLGLALALLIAALSAGNACLSEETVNYVENQWNFVDGSMDISEGIPKSVTEGALVRIREAGVLRVATEPYYPPQEFIDPDFSGQETYQGADMERARTIARKMGVELEIVPMEFTQVLNAVRDGACDLAISALSFTPARASMVEMSKGYNYAGEDAGSALLIREADLEVITGVIDELLASGQYREWYDRYEARAAELGL